MTERDDVKPEPCPFCAGKAYIQYAAGFGFEQPPDKSMAIAGCLSCGISTANYAATAKTIAAWNRRASPPAPAVAVKPLEWEDIGGGWYKAEGLRIMDSLRREPGRFILDAGTAARQKFDTLYAAKAAAQADHDRRIRSALVEPAHTELCEDEGCDHHGTPHVCISKPAPDMAVPEGWKLVPIEPTREMWAAMADTLYRYKNRHHDKVAADLFNAMLAAAPEPPAKRGRDYAGLVEPHEDVERTIAIIRDAYDWTVTQDGYLAGLVAGDQGWATTSILIKDGAAASPSPLDEPPPSTMRRMTACPQCGASFKEFAGGAGRCANDHVVGNAWEALPARDDRFTPQERAFWDAAVDFLNRRVKVEDTLIAVATGKRGPIEAAEAKSLAVQLGVPTPPERELTAEPVSLIYTNWRGETAERSIIPINVWFGSTDWHPEPQWLLRAFDVEKQADRDFALKNFGPSPSHADGIRDVDWLAQTIRTVDGNNSLGAGALAEAIIRALAKDAAP